MYFEYLWYFLLIYNIYLCRSKKKLLKRQSLKRISFLAHSLGGLFARYAIAVLYSPDTYSRDQPGDLANSMTENSQGTTLSRGGMIAGLEPINFITLATPHLGVRGKKQVCSGRYNLFAVYIDFYLKHLYIRFVLSFFFKT